MSYFSRGFNQYWQTVANTDQKLVPEKPKSKAVVLNFGNKKVQEVKFITPEPDEVIEERACILASDIGLPFEWAESVVKLRNTRKPKNIATASWLEIKKACNALYTDNFALLKAIIAHDWLLYDIYGCNLNNPCGSFNNMGLLLLLKPTDKIVEVRKERIRISSTSGNISSFYPSFDRDLKNALLYELL